MVTGLRQKSLDRFCQNLANFVKKNGQRIKEDLCISHAAFIYNLRHCTFDRFFLINLNVNTECMCGK